jgi:hypothetical protein
MSNQLPATPVPVESWGEVRTRDQVVRYRRSGSGRAVLVLHSPEASEPLWPEMLDLLAASGRVIVPTPPAPSIEVDQWLALMLDGLGLMNVVLVAAEGFCMAAIERALMEPDRIARIIIACTGGKDAPLVADVQARLGTVPLLILRREDPAADVLEVVADFLSAT